jgi:microcystin-dependent protein
MRRHPYPFRLAAVLAFAELAGLFSSGLAHATPITGSGVPITTEQPSLGVTYLVRTSATNIADFGQVVAFAGNFAPAGFSVANGQFLSIPTNAVLFSQIGTTYGGNGTTTFALPNLSGSTVVGTGQGVGLTNRALGSTAGATTQTLTAGELPPFGGASGISTGGRPISTLQPSLALNETVVTQGFFPSATGAQATGPLVGQVLTYAGATPPSGQIAANGQQILINQQQPLFSVIGSTYGGDFPITFAAPNLDGRAATGAGAAPGLAPQPLGATAGAESTTLSVANLPPQPLVLSNGTTAMVGGDQPFSVMQPTLGLNYIIATQGVFPTENTVVPDGMPFLGEISLFAGTTAPAGWAFADGQLLSIAANPALFSVIGDTFGGNGIFNFALPNLEDRVAVGTGDGVSLGEMFGADSDTLNFAELPVGYPAAVPTVAAVPEPGSLSVMLTGLLGLIAWRRRPRPVRDGAAGNPSGGSRSRRRGQKAMG